MGGLVFGCSLLVGETRLAVQNVEEEAKLVRERFKDYLTASEKAGEPGKASCDWVQSPHA